MHHFRVFSSYLSKSERVPRCPGLQSLTRLNIPLVEAYISDSKSPRPGVGIVIIPDILGHRFLSTQLFADQLAANGYTTIVPDVLNGDPVPPSRPPGFDPNKWLEGHPPESIEPVIERTVSFLKSEMGIEKIGGLGFSLGGKVC